MTKLVRPQKISDQILSILEERIATGVYEKGGKIPPERTLAEEFGVSRPSVRVALNILIARQVLEARQGDGWLLRFRQTATRFPPKLAGIARQTYQLGNRRFRFQLSR